VAVVLALAAGVLGLLAASRTWVTADLSDALARRVQLRLTGARLAPVVPAVSLVLLAAGAAVLLARRLGRAVAGLVLVLAGAACAAAAVTAARSPQSALGVEAARVTGRSAGPQGIFATTSWPWLAVVAGGLAVLAGALVVVGARRWTVASDRFEAPVAADGRSVGGPSGIEPAVGGGGAAAGPAADAEPAEAQRPDAGPADVQGREAEPADVWDALSRGEDPTR
jgi:uncharacterized membrane protein (TIGR02234 family)